MSGMENAERLFSRLQRELDHRSASNGLAPSTGTPAPAPSDLFAPSLKRANSETARKDDFSFRFGDVLEEHGAFSSFSTSQTSLLKSFLDCDRLPDIARETSGKLGGLMKSIQSADVLRGGGTASSSSSSDSSNPESSKKLFDPTTSNLAAVGGTSTSSSTTRGARAGSAGRAAATTPANSSSGTTDREARLKQRLAARMAAMVAARGKAGHSSRSR